MNMLNNVVKKDNLFKRENIYLIILILIVFFFDRASKSIIINNFSESVYFVNDFINFDLIWNTGIGFGLLSSNSDFFYNSITALIGLIIILLFMFAINLNRFEKLIFSIIVGGAIGNFYDRVIYKAVPDFIDLHYKSFHWFTFNLADIFITLGIIAFLTKDYFIKHKQ